MSETEPKGEHQWIARVVGYRYIYLLLGIGLLCVLIAMAGLSIIARYHDRAQINSIKANQTKISTLQAKLDSAYKIIDSLEHTAAANTRRSKQNQQAIRRQRTLIAKLDGQLIALGVVPVNQITPTIEPQSIIVTTPPQSKSPSPMPTHKMGSSTPPTKKPKPTPKPTCTGLQVIGCLVGGLDVGGAP